jgi:hypothetical protein
MMILLRIFPKQDLSDSWRRAVANSDKISNKDCTPLYVSQQEEKDFMSIMYDVKNIDSFTDVLVNKISSIVNSKKTRTITLLGAVFFPAPKDRPEQLERYQVALRVASDEVNNIFNRILHLEYPVDLFPTYAAFSFGEDDILVSMLSTNRDKARAFVKEKIESQKGVMSVDVARIDMSKRLAPLEMWRHYREEKYLFKPSEGFEEYDFTEQALLSGAFEKEIE